MSENNLFDFKRMRSRQAAFFVNHPLVMDDLSEKDIFSNRPSVMGDLRTAAYNRLYRWQ